MRAPARWRWGLWLALLGAPGAAADVVVSRHVGDAASIEALRAAPAGQWQPADAIRNQGAPSYWRLQARAPAGTDLVIALREAFEAELVVWLPPDYRPQHPRTFDPAWRQPGSRHRLALRLPAAVAQAPVYLQFVRGRSQPVRATAAPLEDYFRQDLARVRFTTAVLTTLALLALVATVFAVALRRWRLLAFVAWIASCAVYVAVMSGEVTAWIDDAGLLRHAMRASLVATNLGVVAIYLFSIGFLDLPRHLPRLARAIEATLAATLVLSLVVAVQPLNAWALQGTNLAAMLLAALGLGGAAARAWKGSPQGWFFLVGLGTVSVIGTLRVLGFLRQEGTSPLLEWLHPAAYAFGALVLILATARAARYAEREMHAARAVARTDALTRLPNRAELRPGLEGLVRAAHQGGAPLSAMFLDLDHFKSINDRFGHAVGDRCLVAVGTILRRHVRASDLVARYGGEEFVLALDGAGAERAVAAAEMLRAAVQEEGRVVDGVPVALTVSIGVAVLAPGESLDGWLARADAALYRAKQGGRNRAVLAEAAEPAVAA